MKTENVIHECSCGQSFSWIFDWEFEEQECPHCGRKYKVEFDENYDGDYYVWLS